MMDSKEFGLFLEELKKKPLEHVFHVKIHIGEWYNDKMEITFLDGPLRDESFEIGYEDRSY